MRPEGPVRIEKTKVLSRDVLVAKLSGAAEGTVAVVQRGGDFYFARPDSLGGKVEKVPADSLTDCLHQAVYEMCEKFEKKNGKKNSKEIRKVGGGCPP